MEVSEYYTRFYSFLMRGENHIKASSFIADNPRVLCCHFCLSDKYAGHSTVTSGCLSPYINYIKI